MGKRETASASTWSVAALRQALEANPALQHLREFALGFNPKLVTPEGERWIAYYGYGAGVVRLSLGDNSKLGGAVRGGAARWFFFPDATVLVGEEVWQRQDSSRFTTSTLSFSPIRKYFANRSFA